MQNSLSTKMQRLVALLTVLLIFKVTIAVILGYVNYFPPNFQSEFLRGRELSFYGSYQWAFYFHIVFGPISLIIGSLLISQLFRQRFPAWHRYLGRIQVMNVLFVVAPSGLWMGFYASAGTIAGIGFAILAVLTGAFVALGWRSAIKRRFADHRRWMLRCYLLLCSAVVIRVIGGLGTVMEVEAPWFNTLASWISWVLPLAFFELSGLCKRQISLSQKQPARVLKKHAIERQT